MSTPEIRKRYKPPRYTLIQQLKLVRGWWRFKVWGLCPACNSDAPEVDGCQVCGGAWYETSEIEMQQRISRVLWWNRFKTRLRLKDYGR